MRRTAALARYEMKKINVRPWDEQLEWQQWTWLGHIARGKGYSHAVLNSLNGIEIRTQASAIKSKYGAGWMQGTRDKFKWAENLRTTYCDPPNRFRAQDPPFVQDLPHQAHCSETTRSIKRGLQPYASDRLE